ncbi:Cytochrome oxidase biogenesis protein Sco1/SenC/PrrC, putative copper metallochaperone [Rhodopirellula islandica]|uniref:Cytochrome oxidase biogenesis protein Sco1/SenC/PrrC, putative copper metallochaperone n=1 Tax=Rhodopirellula islandica TaxID=595434 RepID=A0A0J1BJ73_RHOIS|nr:SCO family protein [Rhodopirellula islandica]KLU06600.1 Cytochrome oxidase biogenesis protein Sco1/SenC/PrrC, putative copper metallochaperone [Rhodopirellula islandica]
MKIFTHVTLILVAGIALGLFARQLRRSAAPADGPGEGEVIYGNDNAVVDNATLRPEDIANDTPTKPPEDVAWLSEFELLERSGEMVSTDDLKGAPYVVSFFFSTCPSICVSQNQKLKELQDEFAGRGVRFVAISVDPETDTPEVLQEYAARFGADPDQWLFLTGDLNYIRRIGAEIFQQPVNKQFHTERFVLVDADGKIEGFYNWPEKRQLEELKASIESMLQEEASSKKS